MAIYKKKKGKDKGMKKKSSGSNPVKLGSPGGSIKQSSDPIISDLPIQSNVARTDPVLIVPNSLKNAFVPS